MEKSKLREIVLDQKQIYQHSDGIERDVEINQFERLKKSEQAIVISGIRRSGKSTLLNHIRKQYKNSDYYFNFDDDRLTNFSVNDFQALYEIFIELFGEQRNFFFDEIQNIEGWEKFIRRLHDYKNKIFVTGSNATMLSKELGTHLTGRYLQLELFPFSFYEYLIFNNEKPKKHYDTKDKIKMVRSFKQYLESGGFPGYLHSKDIEYIKTIFDNILYRDIVARYSIEKIGALKELVYYAASNIGKEISFNGIAKLIGVKNSSTVKEYFEYLKNSYLFFLLPRFDYSLKKQIYANKKIYIIDNAMARILGFRFSKDEGRMLENKVFIELMRRGKECFYHNKNKECDYIIRDEMKIVEAIQVTVSLENQDTYAREIAGLLDAMEAYKLKSGLIITIDEEGEKIVTQNKVRYKIKIIPAWKWMLGRDLSVDL